MYCFSSKKITLPITRKLLKHSLFQKHYCMSLSKYQKFVAVTIGRQEIKNAPYNPRVITDEEKKNLRRLIKKHGIVETLVWNIRTGNLVGGHQRLNILDALEG